MTSGTLALPATKEAGQPTKESYVGWQVTARRLVGDACLDEHRKVNKGKKRHVPYRVPDWCGEVLAAVEAGREADCKGMMHAVRIGCLTLIS